MLCEHLHLQIKNQISIILRIEGQIEHRLIFFGLDTAVTLTHKGIIMFNAQHLF